jgi:hypothetical protein
MDTYDSQISKPNPLKHCKYSKILQTIMNLQQHKASTHELQQVDSEITDTLLKLAQQYSRVSQHKDQWTLVPAKIGHRPHVLETYGEKKIILVATSANLLIHWKIKG